MEKNISVTVEYGVKGKSAYELAVDNGFVGTEQAWLDSLHSVGDQSAIVEAINAIPAFPDQKLDDLSDALSGLDALDSGLRVKIVDMPEGAATEATLSSLNNKMAAKGQSPAANSLSVIISQDQTDLPTKSTITPKASNGYGTTRHMYIQLDGGSGIVNVTGSGDFVATSMGAVSALINASGVSHNFMHIDTTEECFITFYNTTVAATLGLQTSVKHRYRLRVGANTLPAKDNQFGTGYAFTITKGGTLGNTAKVGSSGSPAVIIINLNYVA